MAERERERAQAGRVAAREERETGSLLIREPNEGLNPQTLES